jgi:hypothetical protein
MFLYNESCYGILKFSLFWIYRWTDGPTEQARAHTIITRVLFCLF